MYGKVIGSRRLRKGHEINVWGFMPLEIVVEDHWPHFQALWLVDPLLYVILDYLLETQCPQPTLNLP